MYRRYEEDRHDGGGNVNRLVTIMGNMEKHKTGYVTYSSIFTRRNYDQAKEFFEGLLTGPDAARVFVFAFAESTQEDAVEWCVRLVIFRTPKETLSNGLHTKWCLMICTRNGVK